MLSLYANIVAIFWVNLRDNNKYEIQYVPFLYKCAKFYATTNAKIHLCYCLVYLRQCLQIMFLISFGVWCKGWCLVYFRFFFLFLFFYMYFVEDFNSIWFFPPFTICVTILLKFWFYFETSLFHLSWFSSTCMYFTCMLDDPTKPSLLKTNFVEFQGVIHTVRYSI